MADGANTFYLTTPIYYPNAGPHLGHVYTTIAADTIARYHRWSGDDTYFLTGTDEHGIKMVKTAAEKGVEPRQLADSVVVVFHGTWKKLHITNDDFIRTTSEKHKTAVSKIVEKIVANGDIYLGGYEGWYDEGQEEFVTETEAKEADFKSKVSGRPLTRYTEPTYFFKLKKYAMRVAEYIRSNPEFVQPESRRNEVLSKLAQGVEDLSISRATLKWGIPLPHDPGHVLYVWIDALSNYITALNYTTSDESLFQKYWPANLHLIGKEILWFHTVYWPAILFSLELPLPKKVFAHGWWTSDGRKMSKSMGNFIDLAKLHSLVADHSEDALRFYLLRAAPFGSDLDFSDADFTKAFNELANVVGNLLNRTVNMVGKYRGGKVPAIEANAPHDPIDASLANAIRALPEQLAAAYAKIELQQACLLPVELARAANGFIDATRPFSLAKDPAQSARLDVVLSLALSAAKTALAALLPVLPEKALAGLQQLGIDTTGKTIQQLMTEPLAAGHSLGTAQPLFPKVETK